MDETVKEFRFSGGPVGLQARPLAPVILLLSVLVIIAISQSILAIFLSVAVAAVCFYFWLRPPDLNFRVEVHPRELVIRLVTVTRIRYSEIQEVDLHRWEHQGVTRAIRNGMIKGTNFFGASYELEGAKGELDRGAVIMRFNQIVWVLMPFPPFVLPRKNWLLLVEDAESLLAEIRKRLE